MNLRPYQIEAIVKANTAFKEGKKRIIICIPTGGGKTATGTEMVRRATEKGMRVLWLAHRKELIDQAASAIERAGLTRYGVIMAQHPRHRPNYPVQIASVQTLSRRNMAMYGKFDLVIPDEAHHACADSNLELMQEVCKHSGNPYVVGLTATPSRMDGKGLGIAGFEEIIETVSVSELQEMGFLVPTRIAGARRKAPKVKMVGGEYSASDLAEQMESAHILGDIKNEFRKHGAGRKALAFFPTLEYSKRVAEELRLDGLRAVHIDADTPPQEREKLVREAREGKYHVICNVGLFTEGTDIPIIDCIIGGRRTASMSLFRQMVGRGLRAHPGKRNCLILDHCGWTEDHGYITDPVDWSLDTGIIREKPRELVRCPHCQEKLKVPMPAFCPACAAPLIRKNEAGVREIIECKQVELEEILPGEDYEYPAEYFQKVYAEIYIDWVKRQEFSGGSPYEIIARFKARFGRPPVAEDAGVLPFPFRVFDKATKTNEWKVRIEKGLDINTIKFPGKMTAKSGAFR